MMPPCRCSSDPDLLSQELLRKYITFAKQTCKPKLQAADYDKIAQVGRKSDTASLAPLMIDERRRVADL